MDWVNIKTGEIASRILFIGMEGEQNHTGIVFDASDVFVNYPDATVSMSIKPPVGNIYPKAVERDGNRVIWTVSASDCANHGDGEYQLTFNNGDAIIKTFIGFFRVLISLVNNGTAPEPVEEWIEAAQEALGELEDLSASAETLTPGSSATAEITQVGGHKNIVIGVPAGENGQNGRDGQDGFSPVVSVTDITGGHRVSITDATGTETFDVMDGEDGKAGADGKDGKDGSDGYSPTVTVTDITGGHRVTITDKTGNHTFDVMDGNPEYLIDDTAGLGTTNRTWSANKLKNAIDGKYTKPADGIPASDLASGVIPSVPVTDVQINGTSILSQGVANVPVADVGVFGVVKTSLNGTYGITMRSDGNIQVEPSSEGYVKQGTDARKPIVPARQHYSAFYGLSKAAGVDMASSSNAVGVYTEDAKSKISDMLNAPVSVSGSTPSITAKSGVRYVCGEVSTLSITAPASGCIDVVFESGSTATVLTVTSAKSGVTAVKWVGDFDPTSLDANATYEINIMDGEWGMAVSWT